jgi:hypothetical protein
LTAVHPHSEQRKPAERRDVVLVAMADTLRAGSDNGLRRADGSLRITCENGHMDSVMPYVLALVPTIGMATLFYFVIKSILEGDRRERIAHAKWEKEHQQVDNGTQSAPVPTSKDNSGSAAPDITGR